MSAGLILFAHGARDARWALPFEAVAAQVRSLQPQAAVRLAFLEFMAPDLPTAAADLVGLGCTGIAVVPLFLGAGGHVRRDLPALLDDLRRRHGGVGFELHPAVGEHAAVIDTMARVAADTLR